MSGQRRVTRRRGNLRATADRSCIAGELASGGQRWPPGVQTIVIIYAAAARIAAARGLPEDWLNDAVKGFLPGPDPDAQVLFDGPGLSVRVASPRYILAMKLLASRVDVPGTAVAAPMKR